jgi:hypothetical protein
MQIQYIQNLRTSQGFIFLILQQFATKLCKFTHLKMLFPAVVMDFDCVKARVWTMEYNNYCISSLFNIFQWKCLILCFMSSQTKFNTAYMLIAQIVSLVIFSSFLRLIIGR